MSLAGLKYQPDEDNLPTGGVLHEEDLESNSSAPSLVQATAVSPYEQTLEKEASPAGRNGISHEPQLAEQKEKRYPLKRDITQNSVSVKEANDDDWAKRNQGKNKVLNLVANFTQAEKINASSSSGPSSYKSEYGLGKKIGQIQQNKFH